MVNEPLVLTPEDRSRINVRARRELVQVVGAQAVMGLLVALFAWLVSGPDAAMSALAGAGSYCLPNFLFALRLLIATHSPKGSGPILFFVGEMLKIAATVGLLWLVADLGGDRVQWFAVLAGLIAVLKGYMLMLAFGGSRGKKQ